MGNERFNEAFCYFDVTTRDLVVVKSGWREPGIEIPEEDKMRIPDESLWLIVPFLEKEGRFRSLPMNREEDLKVIHRLLDVVEAQIKEGA